MKEILEIFYNSIADLYERLGANESAIRYFKKSIAIYNKIEEKKTIKAVIYMNIAASYCMMKNYIEAEKYYVCSKAYLKKEIKNQNYYELSLLFVKCMIEFGQKKNQLALEHFEKIVVLVKQKMIDRNNFRYIIAICQYMIKLGYGEQIINFYLEQKVEEWKKIGCYLSIVRLGVFLYQSIGMEEKAKEKALEYVWLHGDEEKHMCELLVSSMNAQFELFYIKKEFINCKLCIKQPY